MRSRTIWTILLIGMLCVNLAAAQGKAQKNNAGGKPQTGQSAAPDPTEELKARVGRLEKDVKALQTPAKPVQADQGSWQLAIWATLIVSVVFNVATVIRLLLATKKLAVVASQNDVTAARDALQAGVANVIQTVNSARDVVRADVTGARGEVTNVLQAVNTVRTDVAAARDALRAEVSNARDTAHSDKNDLYQRLSETRSSLQDTLAELKAKISAP